MNSAKFLVLRQKFLICSSNSVETPCSCSNNKIDSTGECIEQCPNSSPFYSIEYDEKLTVKVKNVKTDIKLDLLLDSIVQKSQNFFKLENELYNVDEISEKPEFGCYIQGLYLEGAEWDVEHNCLQRQLPKKLICNMPLIQVIPAEASKIKLRNNLKTPVYVTQNRKNVKGEGFVFEADLRTLVHPNLWILQGVALLLNTVYGLN